MLRFSNNISKYFKYWKLGAMPQGSPSNGAEKMLESYGLWKMLHLIYNFQGFLAYWGKAFTCFYFSYDNIRPHITVLFLTLLLFLLLLLLSAFILLFYLLVDRRCPKAPVFYTINWKLFSRTLQLQIWNPAWINLCGFFVI